MAKRFGGPEVLTVAERPDPTPGMGEVVLDVAFAQVLFLDVQLRRGWGRDYFTIVPPFVPGVGVAGTVSAVGEGVDADLRGRRVISQTGRPGTYVGGGYAEQVNVPSENLFQVPDGLDLADALAALSDGFMALSRLAAAPVAPEGTAVITAAAGSIGVWLVQLLHRRGQRIVTVAHGRQKLDLLTSLGADAVVDPSEPGFVGSLVDAAAGRPITTVFDGSGGTVGTEALAGLVDGGDFFAYGSASGAFADTSAASLRGIRVHPIDEGSSPAERRGFTDEAIRLLADGQVRPVLGQVVALDQAAQAHRAIEERRVAGKTLLRVIG